MTFTIKQKREAFKNLPEEARSLIMRNETTNIISDSLKNAGLNEDQANAADSEILYSMYCLQSLDEAIENISKLSGKSTGELLRVKEVVQSEILSKYKVDIDEFVKSNKAALQKTADAPQVIPNNLPMIEPGETAHEVPHQEPAVTTTAPIVPTPAAVPPSVAIKDLKPEKPAAAPTPKYSYPGGADPYREPIE